MGLGDLARAIERTDDQTWLAAAALAHQLEAAGAFVAGLCVLREGQALAERLAMVGAPHAGVALLGGDPSAITLEQFVRAGDVRTRLSMIRHKLVPPATYLRHWSPLARRGRLGLLIAYAWRPMWVMMRAPGAVREWLRARRLGRN
jgi:hypothetical protein